MKIAVIGSGNMGTGLSRLLLAAKHKVTLASRTPAQAATKVPGVATATYADAARAAEVIFLAVPHGELKSIASELGGLAGKIVVDLTNPLTPDYMGLTIGFSTSAGEQVQALFPSAKVVKAFNTIFAQVLAKAARNAKSLPTVLVAGNDSAANETVLSLARELGFHAVVTGGLANARYLEPLAELQIQLAYGQGHGAEVGFHYAPVA